MFIFDTQIVKLCCRTFLCPASFPLFYVNVCFLQSFFPLFSFQIIELWSACCMYKNKADFCWNFVRLVLNPTSLDFIALQNLPITISFSKDYIIKNLRENNLQSLSTKLFIECLDELESLTFFRALVWSSICFPNHYQIRHWIRW